MLRSNNSLCYIPAATFITSEKEGEKMVKWELKKIFIKQYGASLLAVFLGLEIIFALEIP